MPHISKKKLDKKVLDSFYSELVKSFDRSFNEIKSKQVFYEFFTYTEKIMFAKRLAVIAMLSKDLSTYAIAEALCMSPSTVERMSLNYENGKYASIERYALGKKDIWEIIESILTVGGIMPPRAGYHRWIINRNKKSDYKEKLKNT